MKVTLTLSLMLNMLILLCVFSYHQTHVKDQELIVKYANQLSVWQHNAYYALDLAQTCAEGTAPEKK